MLYYKAWLETRTRFYTALLATLGVCAFWTLGHTWIESNWQRDLIEHPEYNNPAWFLRAMRDYPFYLWHFVYAENVSEDLGDPRGAARHRRPVSGSSPRDRGIHAVAAREPAARCSERARW